MFHDSSWDGTVVLREGEEGAGSGHDRPGRSVLRMDGGPLRCWVTVGTPARVLLALGVADRGARAAARVGARSPSRAVGSWRRAGGAADRRRPSGA
ncbi:hypothetical protein LV779_11420 [Streptomyces thinghirensis]|nr:hypothetical protein [Streptomyces thinghirensis]